ncbi:MAG: hypothetical protein ACTSXD_05700 [Candidatus Heimdallarchaeaceae archaeon]
MMRAQIVDNLMDIIDDFVKDILNLCDECFINPFVKTYAGRYSACMFCSALQLKNDGSDHSSDCPVIKYQDIIKKYKREEE